MLTLTLRPSEGLTPADLLRLANRSWSILWRRLRRRWGPRAVGYAKIVELTKAGVPHLHILVECPFIAQRELSAMWSELTGSFIVDIRRVRSRRGISGYLSNYLTKALDVPPGMRKWSSARGWVPPEQSPELQPGEIPPAATFRNAELESIVAAYLASGWQYRGSWLIAPEIVPKSPT